MFGGVNVEICDIGVSGGGLDVALSHAEGVVSCGPRGMGSVGQGLYHDVLQVYAHPLR